MNYFASKLFYVFMGVVFIFTGLFGALLAISPAAKGESIEYFGLTMAFLWIGIGTYHAIKAYRRVNDFQKMTYDAYKAKHPEAMRGSRPTCFKCKGDRVFVRNIMQHTYHRAHVCGDCGTTLYYSRELR